MNDSRLTHEFYNCGKKMNNKLYNLKARFVCIIIKLGIIMNDQIMTGNPTAIAHPFGRPISRNPPYHGSSVLRFLTMVD